MVRYDPALIKQDADLLALAGADTRLARVSGDEHAGACPKCGGEDRFHVTPQWWFCRQCHPQRGDAIGYVQWVRGVGFADACALLGGDKQALGGPVRRSAPRSAPPAPEIPDTAPPGPLWQERAAALVDHCAALLWADDTALAYLRGRGLRDETIRAARLGWSPGFPRPGSKARGDDPARWGLEAYKHKYGVHIPRGWVIPCGTPGALWYVKVRRTPEDIAADKAAGKRDSENPRYLCIPGSVKRGAVYGLDAARGAVDVILAEGEINALVLSQELAGVAATVSVGDAGNRPGAQALDVLARVPRPWAAYDADIAGKRGAETLRALFPRVRPLERPAGDPGGKYDPNDALLDGVDLAAWAIPQVGPQGDKRAPWVEYHRGRLAAQAGDGGPVDRVLSALGGGAATAPDEPPPAVSDAWAPDPAPDPDPPAPAVKRALPPGLTLWPDDPPEGWQAAPTPDWAPPDPPGYRRRWYFNTATGLWCSIV